jgi:hypothetical protein
MQRSFAISLAASPPPDPEKGGRGAAPSPSSKPPTKKSKINSRRNRRNEFLRPAPTNIQQQGQFRYFG